MADWTPQSRAEEILFKTINGEPYDGLPQSRIEELLLELKEVIEDGGGGGGGTDNYNSLKNLPQINGQTVKGNMSGTTLGLVNMVMGKDLSTNDYTNADKAIVDSVTAALADKVDKITGKGLSTNDYTNADKAIVDGVTSALAGKADASSVPTKTSDLTNDSGFITNTVNNLVNYYLKTETYSKTEVDALLQAITTLDIQAVSTLPTTNISTTTIYLVPKQDPQVPDIKDEYINLDGTTSGWELIGNTQIDLSNYVTTSDLTTALQSYVTTANLTTILANYATTSALGNFSDATTTDKSSVVAMVNELNANYEGVDLTVKFANEIVNYSDEWAWIQSRLDNHNVRDLHVGDYIPINIAANGGIAAETHKAEIAGINTYRRTGDTGHEVGYHIDWITRDCYSQTVQFNTTNNNNGNANSPSPFLASNLKSWLDGTLYPLLDAKLKNVIKAKRILAPSRYQSGATLTDDNSWAWQDFDKLWVPLETEIFDCLVWSTKGFGNGQAVQYPIFANSYEHRMKGVGPGGARAAWWTASAYSGYSTNVVNVTTDGTSGSNIASNAFCVPVCFRTMEA